VTAIIRLIDPTLPTAIKFVRQYKAKKVIYDVEMMSAADSQAIRDAYGLFWRKRSGRRLPDGLKGLSLSNATTFPTRVRVRLLKEICRLHQAANPTLSCFVTNYLPRPELKIRDRKGPMLSLTYTKAVLRMSYHLSLDFLKDLYNYAKTNLPEEEVTERFLILSPDLLCTASGDLISMSVDEGTSSAPPVAAVPMPQPTTSSTPVLTTPPLGTHAIPSPPAPNPNQGPHLQNNPSLIPSSQPGPQLVASPFLSASSQEEFTLVSRRGRTRFSQRAAPYMAPQ
jgi:hypothetical protein